MFDPLWRRRALAGLGEPFDLIVLGGGITGCGIFLDAAQRGLRVLLLEKGDIASGTSSRSSKLIHGGLRYLKRLQLHVTRLAIHERDRMLTVDPHLVWPIRFIYPVAQGGRPPGWQVEIGLRLYDWLSGRQRHLRLSSEELQRLAPGASTERLDVTFSYGDAAADDARLTLAVASTGAAFGGLLLTRIELEEGVRDAAGELRGVRFRDLETGEVHAAEASLVVNATGAWVDSVRHRLGAAGARIRPSRGSHLIFARERLPITDAVTIPSPDDRRPIFFIPHPEGVLAGTTDLFHDGDLDDPRPSPAEVAYILRSVQTAFPGRGIGPQDIRGAFAGVRPIVDTGAGDPSAASREEAVWEEAGLLSIAGGKLTTWRAMAEEVVDRALRLLPAERARHAAPCSTMGTPVGAPAPRDLDVRLCAVHGLDPAVASGMARRLGGLAWTACGFSQGARSADDFHPLLDGTDLCAAEVRGHLRHGAVARLDDLLLRRARFGLWDPPVAAALVPRLAPLFREELGWSSARWNQETEAAHRALAAWTPQGCADEGRNGRDTLPGQSQGGSGRAGRIWEELRPQRAREQGRAIIAADPTAADRELAQSLAGDPPDRIVVIGGDGSVHLAVNALFRAGLQDRVSLGLVPAGTGSDLARTLGLPREPREALARALAAVPRPLDALAVLVDGREPHWALNVASAGISGLVDEMVNAQPVRGTTAFLTATLKALGRYQPFSGRIELDGEPWYQGGVFLLAIANGRCFGKGMRVAPHAEVDDGLADVVLVRPMPRWQIPLRMPRIYLGAHLDQQSVSWRRARRIRLEPEGPFPPFDVDGELLPSGAVTFELLPGATRFA